MLARQVGKTSAFIGPFVSSAIITAADNNDNMPFAFLFPLYVVHISMSVRYRVLTFSRGVLSTAFLWLVDVEKSRVECDAFILAEAKRKVFVATNDIVGETQ